MPVKNSVAPHMSAMPVSRALAGSGLREKAPLAARFAVFFNTSSIGRPPAGNVEHRACRERAIGGRAECDQGRYLADLHEPRARDFRKHVINMLLCDLV